MTGASRNLKPADYDCANALGSAISKISGHYEQLIDYDQMPREEALDLAKQEAIAAAVASDAVEACVEIIDVKDVPLAMPIALRLRRSVT